MPEDIASSMVSSLTADQEIKEFRKALSWARKFIVIVTVVVCLSLGAVTGVGYSSLSSSEAQNQRISQQIDSTVTSHNTELKQTLDTLCILIQSDAQLAPLVPPACPPLSAKEKQGIQVAQAAQAKTEQVLVAQNNELVQVLNVACILINSSSQLKSYAPAACKGVPAP